MKTTLLAVAFVAVTLPAHADECWGRLKIINHTLVVATGESICRINGNKANVRKGCKLGQLCAVVGTTTLCPDSGECVDINAIAGWRQLKPD
jgi:hypothetical protein